MTDWQQPLVVALTQAKGLSIVHGRSTRTASASRTRCAAWARPSRSTRSAWAGATAGSGSATTSHSAVVSGPTRHRGRHRGARPARRLLPPHRRVAAKGTSTVRGMASRRGYEFQQAGRARRGRPSGLTVRGTPGGATTTVTASHAVRVAGASPDAHVLDVWSGPAERFETYTRWSLYFLSGTEPFIALALMGATGRSTRRWRGSGWRSSSCTRWYPSFCAPGSGTSSADAASTRSCSRPSGSSRSRSPRPSAPSPWTAPTTSPRAVYYAMLLGLGYGVLALVPLLTFRRVALVAARRVPGAPCGWAPGP